jgi:short-subunit dehydrogenase
MKLLEGKVAIITGASRGIGIAEVLLNRVQMLLYIQFISRICGSFRKELNV